MLEKRLSRQREHHNEGALMATIDSISRTAHV
jgi:hypothetical protein